MRPDRLARALEVAKDLRERTVNMAEGSVVYCEVSVPMVNEAANLLEALVEEAAAS